MPFQFSMIIISAVRVLVFSARLKGRSGTQMSPASGEASPRYRIPDLNVSLFRALAVFILPLKDQTSLGISQCPGKQQVIVNISLLSLLEKRKSS